MADEPRDPEVERAINAVDRWDKIVDTFEHFIEVTVTTSRHNTRYRLNLLWVHAFSALAMAPLLFLTGRAGLSGASFSFLRTVPGAPYSFAILLMISGLILGMGCVFRNKIVEIVGLGGLACFYLMFSISFAVPAIKYAFYQEAWIGPKPPFYGAVVYAHLTIIMVLHFIGLIIKLRDEKIKGLPPDEDGNVS